MKYPFEVPFEQVECDLDAFVSVVFSSLESEFLVLPKGDGFVEYPAFEGAYELLKKTTEGFSALDVDAVVAAAIKTPLILVVLRAMLGFTPSEWGYLASQRTGVAISQGFVRSLDRRVRMSPATPLGRSSDSISRVHALVDTACKLLSTSAPGVPSDRIHRLDKADTRVGLPGIRTLATVGVPYAMLLYERFLGRPFAGHRDSVSELVGADSESAIEDVLTSAGVSYRPTKRAERLPGFDQAPDFVVPSEFNPQVVIEAKITEDDGTARDKVTRIQHLAAISREGMPPGECRFEVVACIGGRGFGVRREDMKKLLLATRGKVFTPRTLDRLVDCTRLREYRTL